MPYVTFGYCDRSLETSARAKAIGNGKSAAKSIAQEQLHGDGRLPRNFSIDQTLKAHDEPMIIQNPFGIAGAPADSVNNPAMSLDEFYYNYGDMDKRNENQVVTRCFLLDNEQRSQSRKRDNGRTRTRAKQIRNGDGVPEEHDKWPYLIVGQLWLWVLDESMCPNRRLSCAIHTVSND